MYREKNIFWDRLGMSLSAACIMHCLLIPVILFLLPLSTIAYSMHEWAHPILLAAIVPSVLFSFTTGCGSVKSTIFLALGLTLLLIAWAMHGGSVWFPETLLTISGSFSLIAGHWFNYRCGLIRAVKGNTSKYKLG